MARFKKDAKKEVPELNMGSMSDIIFMFLFFFMVITTMRESDLFVTITEPAASAVQKLEKKSLVVNINIGPPYNKQKFGSEPRIQLDDKFANPNDIVDFVEGEKRKRGEEAGLITWSLKVDQSVKMGIVTDVKQEMRKASAFKVNYSTIRENKR
jgi:biopolymer transport protein ExbD